MSFVLRALRPRSSHWRVGVGACMGVSAVALAWTSHANSLHADGHPVGLTGRAKLSADGALRLGRRTLATAARSVEAKGGLSGSTGAEKVANAEAGRQSVSVFLDHTTQRKLLNAFPSKYSVLRCNKVLMDHKAMEVLRSFKGCEITLGLECYVDDCERQVLQLCVSETEPFGDSGKDLESVKMYIVLSSMKVEEEDNEHGSMQKTAQVAVTKALNHLGHMALTTTSWAGQVKCPVAGELKYSYQQVEGAEINGILCSNKTWDANEGKCDCECSGLVEVEPKVECGFCKFMKAGPCGIQFAMWEICQQEHNSEDFVRACGEVTMQLKNCVDKEQEYYGVLDEIAKEQEDKDEFDKEREAARQNKEQKDAVSTEHP